MPVQQQLRVVAFVLIIITTTTHAANWKVTIADPEPEISDNGKPVWSAEKSEDLPSEKQDLAKSGTAWIRSYNKPPGTNVATIYDSDESDTWDPVKNFQTSDPTPKGPNLFSIAKKPPGSIRYGTKTSVTIPPATSSVDQERYPQMNTTKSSYSTQVTSEERKDKNRKDVIWTATPINRYRDWSLKTTAARDGWYMDSDYSPLSISNGTVMTYNMAQRRETDENSTDKYDDPAEVSIEDGNVDSKGWKVVDEDGVDGWKVLDKEGNVEWEIKLENGSWVVMDRGGDFSHKVDIPTVLNDSNLFDNYDNDYLTDYGNYYEETNYGIPGEGEVYLVSNYDNAWPKVTNIAIPEPWHAEDYPNNQEVSDFWPHETNSSTSLNSEDETTTIATTTTADTITTSATTTTQAPVTTVKQSMETETTMMEMTDQPPITTKPATQTNGRNTADSGPRHYNQNRYYAGYKGTPFNKHPTKLVKLIPVNEDSTFNSNENLPNKYTLKSSYSNNASPTSSPKKIVQSKNQNSKKTSSQWITRYGSQTWKVGSGKNQWDNINSTADSPANKASIWGTGYGTKVWKGDDWNSKVVWKTGYDQGQWNVNNGTGTFNFPSNIYANVEKKQRGGSYKGKPFIPNTSFPQSRKNYTNAHQNVFILYEDTPSDNSDNQDVANSEQEEWGDEKSVGGVVWQEDEKPSLEETTWKYPENTDTGIPNDKTPKDKKYTSKAWNNKWSGAHLSIAGPDWKPSTMLSEKNGWKPSGTDNENWKMRNINKNDSPEDESTIEEPDKQLESPNKNPTTRKQRQGNNKIYKPNNPQFWNVDPGSYKTGSWKTHHGNNLPKPGWNVVGKSWKPPTFVWQEGDLEASTTTAATTTDPKELPPAVTYSLKPNPIYIKWHKPTPSNVEWPVATPISIKWAKPPTKRWRKPTVPIPTTKTSTTTTTPTTTTTSTTTKIPSKTTPKSSSKFPPIRYVWPIKTFNPKSWEPIQVINPPDCKDKTTIVPTTIPTTTTMMETTTTMPVMTTKKMRDHTDKPNIERPPIIVIKKIPPGFKNIKFPNKGKGRPKFRPQPPPHFYEWANYEGKPLQISSSQGKGYYKGTPFKAIAPTKSKKQRKKAKVPKWIKSSYKGSSGSAMPLRQWWPSEKSNYPKWMASNSEIYQKLASSTYKSPKPTWKDALKKIFG